MAALGLGGFVLLASAVVGGELELLVETTETVTGCPTCGLVATAHGRREHLVRDAPLAGLPVAIMWAKRIWRCGDPVCPKKTWTEQHPAIAPRRLPTHGLTAPDSCGVRGLGRLWVVNLRHGPDRPSQAR